MPIPEICLARGDIGGSGGVSGGAGTTGPASGHADGKGVSGGGYPVIAVVTEMKVDLEVILYDTLCSEDVEDLSSIDHMKFVAKESYDAAQQYIDKDVTIGTPASDGKVTIEFVPDDLPYAGIWWAGLQGFDADDNLIAQYPAWLAVEKGLTQQFRTNSPITLSEIRMALRDTCPDFNTLLLDLEFSDTEIAFAITRPIEEWNETPPDVRIYTPATFPFREAWRKATCGYLLQTAAYHYARNNLNYSAGGVSVNDKQKETEYMQMGENLLAKWKEFLMRQKVQMNAEACYGSVLSGAFRGGVYRHYY